MTNQTPQHADPQHGPQVSITIDNTARDIHRGRQTIVDLKKVGEVPAAMELEQVIDGKLSPLADDGAITIKGGEVFISHVRDSSSS